MASPAEILQMIDDEIALRLSDPAEVEVDTGTGSRRFRNRSIAELRMLRKDYAEIVRRNTGKTRLASFGRFHG